FYPTPTTANGMAGKTYKLDYYKKATKYVTGAETQEPEMSDQYFIVNWVLGQLYADDNNDTQAGLNIDIATDKLNSMRTKNESMPFFQRDDVDDGLFGGFGR